MRRQHRLSAGIVVLGLTLILTACDLPAPSYRAPLPTSTQPQSKAQPQGGPYDEKADPAQDIAAAFAQAKADNKYVLLDFGANWCLDCRVLSNYYATDPVKSLLVKSYHLVLIDVGNFDTHLDVVNKYGNPIENGIPALVILDPAGHTLVTTKAGEFADARSMSAQQVLDFLQKWAPKQG